LFNFYANNKYIEFYKPSLVR